MAPPLRSYPLEPPDMMIIRPLLPEVMVSTIAPGPGPTDLTMAVV